MSFNPSINISEVKRLNAERRAEVSPFSGDATHRGSYAGTTAGLSHTLLNGLGPAPVEVPPCLNARRYLEIVQYAQGD